jgi:catalase
MRRSRSPAPIPTSIAATCGTPSKPANTPNGSWACRYSPKPRPKAFSFDVLDATKLIPEELVPVTPVGRMVLNRNPDNFFAETEQVAFCTAHVVPGIDFSNDPLLAGRIHSYVDTQITRLGGANFHEIPINAPLAPCTTTSAMVCTARPSPAAGSPTSPTRSVAAARSRPVRRVSCLSRKPLEGDKLRGKPEKFADHYTQATLFYESQTEVEKAHIIGGFRFELSKLTVPAIRERMLASLVNVSADMAAKIAAGLGMEVPEAMPKGLGEMHAPRSDSSRRRCP